MENREDLARVSVGTVHDWQNVKSKYKEFTLESIQAQIASDKTLERERNAVLAHVEEYIDRTFTFVQPNLRINGNAFESLDESGREMETFDEALDRRIWSLADTRLQWHKRIAEARRTIPREIEVEISALLQQHKELDNTILSQPEDTEEPMTEEISPQQQRLHKIFQQSSALSNELTQTISQQQERGERIQVIASEIASLKP